MKRTIEITINYVDHNKESGTYYVGTLPVCSWERNMWKTYVNEYKINSDVFGIKDEHKNHSTPEEAKKMAEQIVEWFILKLNRKLKV